MNKYGHDAILSKKAIKVVNSCQTSEQKKVAKRWFRLAFGQMETAEGQRSLQYLAPKLGFIVSGSTEHSGPPECVKSQCPIRVGK